MLHTRNAIISFLVGSFFAAAATGMYFFSSSVRAKSGESNKPHFSVHGSISKEYLSTDEFVKDSDLIVVGKFSGKSTIKRPKKIADLPTAESEDKLPPQRNQDLILQRDLGHRDLPFVIRRVLKGDSNVKQILVAQRGAISDETTESDVKAVDGDTLFQSGGQYILFLKKPLSHEVENAGYEFYWILGANQGAYRLKNGKVYSRNVKKKAVGNDESIESEIPEDFGQKVDGIEEGKFLQEVENKAK